MSRITSTTFVGREPERARLLAALERARSGTTTFVLLGGDAGVGKTRLVEELAREAGATGSIVLIGGSPIGSDADLPFGSLVEALRSLVRQLPPARLDDVLGPARGELARVLPTLGDGSSGRPDTDEAAGLDTAQTRLFEGILGVLDRAAVDAGSAMLVLEDLHWADRSTRELLAFLVRNLRDAAILVVGTYRSDGIAAGDPLRTLLAELERSSAVERFELSNLGRPEVEAQLAGILGRPPAPALVDEVFARSDGNPFFVEELTAATEAGIRDSLSDTLRETLLGRISPLPSQVQELLRTAAVAGRSFDPGLIAIVTGLDESTLIAALREAVRQHLLVVVKDGGGERFEFRHALMREAIDADILPLDLSRRHALIAAAYEADPDRLSGTLAEREARLANHWLAAGESRRALPALILAGYAAEAAYAFPEASRAYETALRIWDRATAATAATAPVAEPDTSDRPSPGPIGFRMRQTEEAAPTARPATDDPADKAIGKTDIMRRAAEVAALTGSPGRAVELTRDLVGQLDATTDPLATGLALERLGRYQWEDADTDGALDTYQRAAALVAEAAPAAGQVRVMGAYARALVSAGRYAEAQRICEEAIEAGLAIDAASEVRRVRDTYGVALAFQGDVEAGLEQLVTARTRVVERTATSAARPRPSRIGDVVRGYADLAAILERAGRPGEAADVSLEGTELARSLGVEATWGSTLEVHAAVGRYHLGEWDEADRMTRRLLSGPLRGSPAARLHLVRARLETGRGAFDDAELQIEAARVHLPTAADATLVGELAAAVAELAIWRARLTEARAAVDEGLRRIHVGEDQLPVAQLCWLGVRAEADRAEAARDRRLVAEADDARSVAASLRAELTGIVGRSADREHLAPRELRVFPALVDAEHGRLDGTSAADAWAEAAARAQEVRDPWLVAYARWRESEAALAERGGKTRAETALRSAHEVAVRLAAAPLQREIDALARRGRLDLRPAGPAAVAAEASPMDRLGLTTREQEVLSLVAEGRTNRQIADELFITEKTAGHHVSNVLAKLGASSRVEAAAMAHRAGWLDASPGEPTAR